MYYDIEGKILVVTIIVIVIVLGLLGLYHHGRNVGRLEMVKEIYIEQITGY